MSERRRHRRVAVREDRAADAKVYKGAAHLYDWQTYH